MERIGYDKNKPLILIGCAPCQGFSSHRKKDWDKVGGYDQNMIHGYEDWEFWIAILKKGGSVFQLDKICFYSLMSDKK